jgi:muramoyltetrapeptide carboxypeptidase LdcA involved in peptidoglycan recycling
MLTTLALAGCSTKPSALSSTAAPTAESKAPSLSLDEILSDRFGSLPIPALSGLSFRHIEQKLSAPICARATLDADAGALTIDESATG